ncbi:MAG: STAS domain-containing protein [Planctomycetes bacterium]|nr:STAS domain-containing protein [Planctomycetota bacterium]
MKYSNTGTENNTVSISCFGSVENSNDFRFLEEFLEEGHSVVLNMTEVDYINSCGFGAMVEETMNFSDSDCTLSITGLPPGIRKTLAVLGGEELLSYID